MAYLQEISNINGESFLAALKGKESLRGNNSSGRLFYEAKIYRPSGEDSKSEKSREQIVQEEMDDFFKNERLVEYTMQRVARFEPIMNEKSMGFTKDFVEDFFKPIESSQEWQAFYEDRKRALGEAEAESLAHGIKGAFAYKVIGIIPQERREARKDKLLAKFFSNYPNMSVPIQEYKEKTLYQLTNLQDEIERKSKQLRDLTLGDTAAREQHGDYLLGLMQSLEGNITRVLTMPEFATLGSDTRDHFLLNDMASVLFDIKASLRSLNGIVQESTLKACQTELAKSIVRLISEHNQKGELANLDWDNPKMMSLADFAIQHRSDFRDHFLGRYAKTFELFKTKTAHGNFAPEEYRNETLSRLNMLDEEIARKANQLKTLTSDSGHLEADLLSLLKNLEKNIISVLAMPKSDALGSHTHSHFSFNNIASVLFDIKAILESLRKVVNESTFTSYQVELAKCVVKLINEYSQRDALDDLDWNNPKALTLANLVTQHKSNFHHHFIERYAKAFELLETKVNQYKEETKLKAPGSFSVFSSSEQGETKGTDHEPPEYKG
ncbi:hypothetical protein [Legionella beliardensis]|uniref:hypothetical protein n=1 Tax=Legionella beliardensis TaxID=91822 RepID=UPI001041373D|nr:hypothetical protein [Legionella beliardensis]